MFYKSFIYKSSKYIFLNSQPNVNMRFDQGYQAHRSFLIRVWIQLHRFFLLGQQNNVECPFIIGTSINKIIPKI